MGAADSIKFLYYYSNSDSENFIQSQWKYLVNYKWRGIKKYNICIAIYFVFYLISMTMAIVFKNNERSYAFSLLIILSLLILLEFVQVIAYLRFNIKSYLTDPANYVDWLIFINSTTMAFAFNSPRYSTMNQIGGIVVLMLSYYRCFTYLQIFDYFTWLVEIINAVISKSSRYH